MMRSANHEVAAAIRAGKLVRQPCEQCGKYPTDAHHDDYQKPLEVRWLCRSHHVQHHYQQRENQEKLRLDITAVRLSLGESQKAFGRRFGVDQCTVSRWETEGLPNRGPSKLIERAIRDLRAQ